MIQKFLCPKCGNTFDVPVEGFEVGGTEVDCPCGASMMPSGGLEMETEEPPVRNTLFQRYEKMKTFWKWIALLLLASMIGYFFF